MSLKINGSSQAALSATFVPLARDAGDGVASATKRMRWTDQPSSPGSTFMIEHYGDGSGDTSLGNQTYGIDLHNNTGARSAVVIHQYSNMTPAVWIDNTDTQPALRIHNTANASRNPGRDGTGAFLELQDHGTTTCSWSKDHVLTLGAKTFTLLNNNSGQKVLSLQTAGNLTALEIVKTGSTTGDVVTIENRGTAASLRIKNATVNTFQVSNAGAINTLAGVVVSILAGTGTPEGAYTAPVGSMYLRTDGGAGTSHYVKESGAGNTGWVAK